MNKCLVSIIIPVYNGEKYIVNCLNKIKNQTYKNIEIVIINDGSIDNTKKIIDSYDFEKLKSVIIHKNNTGVSDSRNIGIQNSHGKYVLFLDIDDELTNDAIQYYIDVIKKYNCDVIRGNYILKYQNKIKKSMEDYKTNLYLNESIKKLRYDLYADRFKGFGCLLFIKRKILIDNKIEFPINMLFMEDFIFISSLLNCIDSIYISDHVTYIYNQSINSASHNTNITKRIYNIDQRYISSMNYMNENNLNQEEKEILINGIIYIYLKTQFYIIKNYEIDSKYDVYYQEKVIYNKIQSILCDNGMTLKSLNKKNRILLKIMKIKNKKISIFINKIYTILKGE